MGKLLIFNILTKNSNTLWYKNINFYNLQQLFPLILTKSKYFSFHSFLYKDLFLLSFIHLTHFRFIVPTIKRLSYFLNKFRILFFKKGTNDRFFSALSCNLLFYKFLFFTKLNFFFLYRGFKPFFSNFQKKINFLQFNIFFKKYKYTSYSFF